MSEQDAGKSTADATDNTGANTGDTQKTGQQAYTQADLQREVDRRVTEAQRKWKEQMDGTIADKTRDAESKLAELSGRAEEAERKAGFVESASAAGIRNVNAAYLVAKHGDYIKSGRLDIDKFRKDNPEFFASAPNANAGAGAGVATQSANAFNAWLRQ